MCVNEWSPPLKIEPADEVGEAFMKFLRDGPMPSPEKIKAYIEKYSRPVAVDSKI